LPEIAEVMARSGGFAGFKRRIGFKMDGSDSHAYSARARLGLDPGVGTGLAIRMAQKIDLEHFLVASRRPLGRKMR
jgi:hypothetical protein